MPPRMRFQVSLVSVTVVLVLFAGRTDALPVTVSFSGTFSVLSALEPIVGIQVGDSFTGMFQYDTTAGYSASWDNMTTSYYYPYTSFDLWVSGNHYQLDAAHYSGIDMYNDATYWGNPVDGFFGCVAVTGPAVSGTLSYQPERFCFGFSGPISLFDSTALPTAPLALGMFANQVASLDFRDSTGTGIAFGNLFDSFTTFPVPEPATLLLLGTGVVGVLARRRRR